MSFDSDSMAESHSRQDEYAHRKDDHVALRRVIRLLIRVADGAAIRTDLGTFWHSHAANTAGRPFVIIVVHFLPLSFLKSTMGLSVSNCLNALAGVF